MTPVSRRSLLAQGLFLGVPLFGAAPVGSGILDARLADHPFTLGVASGEPTPDGVVIWTRLAPRPHETGGGMGAAPMAVRWEVAEDERFRRVAARGTAIARSAEAHSVHVEVAGLKPHRTYWYRFLAGGHASNVGRTRTAPAPGAEVSSMRAAFAACQNYTNGFYTAHADMARADPEVVFFLGDYIYEKPISLEGVRRHPIFEADDLESYRLRHAVYKSDPNLQAAHAAAPWMAIWDDHEVENDYGGDQDRHNTDRAAFLRRRAAAYQAYYEHMPLRRSSRPNGARMQLYRSLDWGQLAQFQLLDTRQYRPHRTCEAVSKVKRIPANCAERFDPSRSMLGSPQEAWLRDRFATTTARWNLLTQQQPMTSLVRDDGTVSNDGWDGYPVTRAKVLDAWSQAEVSNPVALGGDIHCFAAGELADQKGRVIGTEFVSGSVSSTAHPDSLPARCFHEGALRFGHKDHRGYGLLHLTKDECRVTFRAVDDALVEHSKVRTLASFVVETGEAGVKRA